MKNINFESKEQFTLDDNDMDFLCRQKWVACLPVLLFTIDNKNAFQ